MTNWYQKEYLCPDCDSFIVITTKSNELRDRNCFECRGELVLISASIEQKTINDLVKEREEANK